MQVDQLLTSLVQLAAQQQKNAASAAATTKALGQQATAGGKKSAAAANAAAMALAAGSQAAEGSTVAVDAGKPTVVAGSTQVSMSLPLQTPPPAPKNPNTVTILQKSAPQPPQATVNSHSFTQ